MKYPFIFNALVKLKNVWAEVRTVSTRKRFKSLHEGKTPVMSVINRELTDHHQGVTPTEQFGICLCFERLEILEWSSSGRG